MLKIFLATTLFTSVTGSVMWSIPTQKFPKPLKSSISNITLKEKHQIVNLLKSIYNRRNQTNEQAILPINQPTNPINPG